MNDAPSKPVANAQEPDSEVLHRSLRSGPLSIETFVSGPATQLLRDPVPETGQKIPPSDWTEAGDLVAGAQALWNCVRGGATAGDDQLLVMVPTTFRA